MYTYHTLHATNEQTVENLARLVGVADILEGLGAILASDVQEDFLTTAVSPYVSFEFFFGWYNLVYYALCDSTESEKIGGLGSEFVLCERGITIGRL